MSHRNHRPHNRPRSGYVGEVVPEKHEGTGRFVVNPVAQGDRRSGTIPVGLYAAALDEPAIKVVAQDQHKHRTQGEKRAIHVALDSFPGQRKEAQDSAEPSA